MDFTNKVVLITGGTGSFGSNFLKLLLKLKPKVIRIYSRDEHKQSTLLNQYGGVGSGNELRGFIGDIRDLSRLKRAMEGVDLVIHAAALKQVQSCEYNPLETIKTNILGAVNLIEASLDCNVEKVIAISTDKAVQPLNLYGATKMCMEKLFINANAYRGVNKRTKFCCTRYGNVVDSRGTIVPIWKDLMIKHKVIPITNPNATRFWIEMCKANQFVMECIELMDVLDGGEVFIPKIPSVKIMDVYQALTGNLNNYTIIGDRIGDKLHEILICPEETRHTIDGGNKFIIYPENPEWHYHKPKGDVCAYGTGYCSNTNQEFLSVEQIKKTLEEKY